MCPISLLGEAWLDGSVSYLRYLSDGMDAIIGVAIVGKLESCGVCFVTAWAVSRELSTPGSCVYRATVADVRGRR